MTYLSSELSTISSLSKNENIDELTFKTGQYLRLADDSLPQNNVKLCEDEKITPYISFGKEQHNQPLEDRFHANSY